MNYLDFNKSLQLFSNNYFSWEYCFTPYSPKVSISPPITPMGAKK